MSENGTAIECHDFDRMTVQQLRALVSTTPGISRYVRMESGKKRDKSKSELVTDFKRLAGAGMEAASNNAGWKEAASHNAEPPGEMQVVEAAGASAADLVLVLPESAPGNSSAHYEVAPEERLGQRYHEASLGLVGAASHISGDESWKAQSCDRIRKIAVTLGIKMKHAGGASKKKEELVTEIQHSLKVDASHSASSQVSPSPVPGAPLEQCLLTTSACGGERRG